MSLIVTSFSALFQPKSVRLIQSTTGGNAEAYAYSYTRAEHISWSVKAFVCVYTRGEKGINLWARPLVQNAAERKNKLWYYDGWAGKKKVKKKKKSWDIRVPRRRFGILPSVRRAFIFITERAQLLTISSVASISSRFASRFADTYSHSDEIVWWNRWISNEYNNNYYHNNISNNYYTW